MSYYKRNLPHWQPGKAEYFITFRLAGSLPAEAIARIKNESMQEIEDKMGSSGSLPERQGAQKKGGGGSDKLSDLRAKIQRSIFIKFEALLDNGEMGPAWLKKPYIAEIVKEAIHHRDHKEYDLYAYSLMPNHVHLIFKLLNKFHTFEETIGYPVTKIMQSLKSYTALKANQALQRSGAFWQAESFDRVIRDVKELERTIVYTLYNPVKAGLVKKWEDWPHSYCKPEFIATLRSSI